MTSLYEYMKQKGIVDGADTYDKELCGEGTCMAYTDRRDGIVDLVCDYILKSVEFTGTGGECAPNDLEGDFSGFVRTNYERMVIFADDCNNHGYSMRHEYMDDNIACGVFSLMNLEKGNYAAVDYKRFAEIFGIVPEGYGVKGWKVLPLQEARA